MAVIPLSALAALGTKTVKASNNSGGGSITVTSTKVSGTSFSEPYASSLTVDAYGYQANGQNVVGRASGSGQSVTGSATGVNLTGGFCKATGNTFGTVYVDI